jgi:hypothetical protein
VKRVDVIDSRQLTDAGITFKEGPPELLGPFERTIATERKFGQMRNFPGCSPRASSITPSRWCSRTGQDHTPSGFPLHPTLPHVRTSITWFHMTKHDHAFVGKAKSCRRIHPPLDLWVTASATGRVHRIGTMPKTDTIRGIPGKLEGPAVMRENCQTAE